MRLSRTTAASAAALCVATMMAFTGNPAGAQTTGEPPVPCADSDLVASDPAMLNRQLSVACNHIESVRAWHEAGRHFYGYEGYRIDWPAALSEYRRAARLAGGHPPGTLGWRRWMFANIRIASMLSFGGRGVTRDLAEARRLVAALGNNPDWLAGLEQSVRAEAEAARPPPRPVLRPGRWRTVVVDSRRDGPEEDVSCIAQEDFDAIMAEGPDSSDSCHWISLSRSPTRFEAQWRCEDVVSTQTGRATWREDHRLQVTMSADRAELVRTTEEQIVHSGQRETSTERGTATRLGDC